MQSSHRVELTKDSSMRRLSVLFYGPKGTPYEGGVWKVFCSSFSS